MNLNSVNPRTNVPIVRNGYILFGRFTSISTFPLYLHAGSISRLIEAVCLLSNDFNKVGLRSVSTPHYFRIRHGLGRVYSVPIFRSSRRNATVIINTTLLGTLHLANGGVSRIGYMVGNTNSTNVTVNGRVLGLNIGGLAVYSHFNVVYRNSPRLGSTRGRVDLVAGHDLTANALTSTVGNTSMFVNISTPGIISRRVIGTVGGSTVIFPVTGPIPRVVPSGTGTTNTEIVNAKHSSFPGRVGGIVTFPNVFHNTLSIETSSVGRRVRVTTSLTVTSLISGRRLGRRCVVPFTFSREVNGAITRGITRTTVGANITQVGGWCGVGAADPWTRVFGCVGLKIIFLFGLVLRVLSNMCCFTLRITSGKTFPTPLSTRERGRLLRLDRGNSVSTHGALVRRGLHLITRVIGGCCTANTSRSSLVSVNAMNLVGTISAFGDSGKVHLTACTTEYVRGTVLA